MQNAIPSVENQAAEVPSASPHSPLITVSAVQHVLHWLMLLILKLQRARKGGDWPLSREEQRLWLLTLSINARGIPIDRDLAVADCAVAQAADHEPNNKPVQMTSGDFTSVEQRLKLWLAQQGCVADAGQGGDRGSSGNRQPAAGSALGTGAPQAMPRLRSRRFKPCSSAVTAMAGRKPECALQSLVLPDRICFSTHSICSASPCSIGRLGLSVLTANWFTRKKIVVGRSGHARRFDSRGPRSCATPSHVQTGNQRMPGEDLAFRLQNLPAPHTMDGSEADAIIDTPVKAVAAAEGDIAHIRAPERKDYPRPQGQLRAPRCPGHQQDFGGRAMLAPMIALGIDPGIRGGLAVVNEGNGVGTLLDAIDIPTVGSGARERVNVLAVRVWIKQQKPHFALIERAQAMPRQGASSGFKYGRATGALEAAVVLCGVPLEIIEPTAWKRFWHLPPKDKERSRQRALELFPAAHALLARKLDHGRAEAALIALYGLRTSRLMATPTGAQPGSINNASNTKDYCNE
jgi:crossover junction endodeoxyribonuclease RuvC